MGAGSENRPVDFQWRRQAKKILLGTQALQDGERGFFGALGLLPSGADARGTAVFTWACRDQLLRATQEQVVDAIERLAEAYAAGVCVINVQIRLEEFSG